MELSEIKNMMQEEYSSYNWKNGNLHIIIRPSFIYMRDYNREYFKLRIPKISSGIYNKIMSLFHTVALFYNCECMARIYWHMQKREFVLRIPRQMVSVSSVSADEAEMDRDDELFELLPVLEIHSHGKVFNAFFSSTDDESELHRYGLFGVVSFAKGRNILIRLCLGGKQLKLSAEDIFDVPKVLELDSDFVKSVMSSGKIIKF